MKRTIKKISAAICIIALVLQTGVFSCLADSTPSYDSETGSPSQTSVHTAGAAASLLNDTLENTDRKTIYTPGDYETNEIAVMYKDGDIKSIKCSDKNELTEKLSELEADPDVDTYQPNFSYSSDALTSSEASSVTGPVYFGSASERLRIKNRIKERASVNISASHPVFPSDAYYSYQWGLHNDGTFRGAMSRVRAVSDVDVNAQEAWSKYKAKRDVTIAVVDTGVDYTNSQISGNMWVNEDEIPGNGIDDDGNGYIDDYRGWNFYDNNNVMYSGYDDDHGTHCAGTMVAASDRIGITGLAAYTNIKVMNVKALGGIDGLGTTLSIIKAIKYAEENGASICNLSLGTEVNDSLLYRTMRDSGMLFVVAAGNSESLNQNGWNIDVRPVYPAAYTLDNIIAVANVTASGNIHYTSDYGAASVDIAAPGTDILGLAAAGRMEYMTGTSMAAPFVTAGAAMVYTGSYGLSLAETRYIIINSAKKITGLESYVSSGGILDVSAALDWK
ncbi:MAG: S8 family peptidase [Eubacteriales bacterium]|jgi:subtilisin family serine protease|nr:S8 family peptidase [Eubacteriales bacterium]